MSETLRMVVSRKKKTGTFGGPFAGGHICFGSICGPSRNYHMSPGSPSQHARSFGNRERAFTFQKVMICVW